jgi:hypothetical protein
VTARDPIEEAGEPIGECDYCRRIGYLAVVRLSVDGNHSWACEECRDDNLGEAAAT